MLATVNDVLARLGDFEDEVDTARVEALLEEATALVEAHLGRTFDEPVPNTVRIVVSRMVARVLEAPTDGFHAESSSYTAGPFSKNVTYSAGASGGAPWLTSTDRKMLRAFGARRGGVWSVELG